MEKVRSRSPLLSVAALMVVLAAILFTGSPVSAQNIAVTVAFEQAAYTVEESDDTLTQTVTENVVEVKVTLSADPQRQVVIPIVATNQGTATGADYSTLPASVTFESGDTEKTITFTATHDVIDDDGESVKLSFGSTQPGFC